MYKPVIQSLLAVKADLKRIEELTPKRDDRSVLQACLDAEGILITFDKGIPSQAYAYEFAKNGVTVVLLRWKGSTYADWQEMVEVILRDDALWKQAALSEPSIISVSYRRGSRIRTWSTIPPMILLQVPSELGK